VREAPPNKALDFFLWRSLGRLMKDLHYTFTCTAAPVQAEGKISGKPFYFRARHEHWSFAVSEDPNTDPIDIQSHEQGSVKGFFIEEGYGNEAFAASYMPLDEAERIIDSCAEMYLRVKAGGEI
jgi:hypothetical protein